MSFTLRPPSSPRMRGCRTAWGARPDGGDPVSMRCALPPLLEREGSANAGALFMSGESLQWRIDVHISATGEELNAAIFLCAELADDFETILTSGKDAY